MNTLTVFPTPLEHEGQQIGYIFVCPECQQEKPIPVAQFLDDATPWNTPPQNVPELSGDGWWHLAEGQEALPTPEGVSFVLPGAARSPQPINCSNGHGPYIVRAGEVILARRDEPIAFQ